MVRTSLIIPAPLYKRLHLASKRKNKSWSQLVRELLDKALVDLEDAQIKRMHADLEKLNGICKDKITDASTTINEVLYGENGVWKGQDE